MPDLTPRDRLEAFLAKIAGGSEDLEPRTRLEAFLDDIAGGDNGLEPETRLEYWLQKIAENGGGGEEGLLSGVLHYDEDQSVLNLEFSRPVSHVHVHVDPAHYTELREATALNVRRLLSVDVTPIGNTRMATGTTSTTLLYTGGNAGMPSPATSINFALYPTSQGSGYLIAGYDYFWAAY